MALENPGVEELSNIQNLNIKSIKNIGNIDQVAPDPEAEEFQVAGFFNIKAKPKTKFDVEPTIKTQEADFANSIFNKDMSVDEVSSMSVLNDINDPNLALTNAINFKHIENVEGIQKTISAIQNKLPDTKRTTLEEIKATAEHTDITAAILDKNKKSFLDHSKPLAPQITAARMLLVDSANKLNNLAKIITENKTRGVIDKELLVEFRRQMALHASIQHQMKGAQTQIAQALASFRIDVESGVVRADNIDLLLRESGGVDSAEKLAVNYLAMVNDKGQKAANKFAERGFFLRSVQAIQEMYAGGLLWSTKTLIRNFLGSAMYSAWELPTRIIAGSYGQMEKALRFQKGINLVHNKLVNGTHWGGNHGYDFQQGLAFVQGYFMSFKDAFSVANTAFKKGVPTDGRTRWEIASTRKLSSDYLGIHGKWGSAIDLLGKTSGVPFKLMLWQDEFMKSIVRQSELRSQASAAYTKVLDAKGTKEAAEEAALKILNDPSLVKTEIDEMARHFVFQDDLGAFTSKIQALQNVPGMRILIPFIKTPVNIVKTVSAMHGHMGLVGLNPKFWKNAKYRQRTMAQMTLTAGTAGLVYNYYASGNITGAPPRDAKVRNNMYEFGWQPYSMVIRDPNIDPSLPLFDEYGIPTGKHKYVSYAGMEPIGGLIAIWTTAFQRMERTRNPQERDNIAMAAVLSAKDYFKEIPYIKVMGDIFKMVDNTYTGDIGAKKLVEDIVGAFLPFSAQLRNLSDLSDATLRELGADFELDLDEFVFDDNGKQVFRNDGKPKINPNYGMPKGNKMILEAVAGFQKIYDNIPGAKQFSEMLEDDYYVPRLDTFGNEMEKNRHLNLGSKIWNYAMPFNIKEGEDLTPGMYEILRLGNPISNIKQNYRNIKLTVRQQHYLTDIAKNVVLINGVDFDTAIEMALMSGVYWGLNDKEKYQYLAKIKKDYYDTAWDQFFQFEYFDVWYAAKQRTDYLNEGLITPFMVQESYENLQ